MLAPAGHRRLRRRLRCGTALALCLALAAPALGQSTLPEVAPGGDGGATITRNLGQGRMSVDVNGANRIVTYDSFELGSTTSSSERLTFLNGGAAGSFSVMNRVTGGSGSKIHGAIEMTSPGLTVWLVDPLGVTFGPTGAFSGGGLVVSTAQLTSAQRTSFLAGTLNTLSDATTAPILFQGGSGVIRATGALVAVGQQVRVDRPVASDGGVVALVAATDVTFANINSPLSFIVTRGTTLSTGVAVGATGAVSGQSVRLAGGVDGAVAAALLQVDQGATLTATAAGGSVVLASATTGGVTVANGAATPGVKVAGTILADGATADAAVVAAGPLTMSGSVTAGRNVALLSGGAGTIGGMVVAGGDYRARGASLSVGDATAAVTQRANGNLLLETSVGGITGLSALTLQANADGTGGGTATLDAAGAVDLATTSNVVGGTAAERTDVVIGTGSSLEFGAVTARALLSEGSATDLSVAGAVRLGDVTVERDLRVASGAGSIAVGRLRSTAGAAALDALLGGVTATAIEAAGRVDIRTLTNVTVGTVTTAAGDVSIASRAGNVAGPALGTPATDGRYLPSFDRAGIVAGGPGSRVTVDTPVGTAQLGAVVAGSGGAATGVDQIAVTSAVIDLPSATAAEGNVNLSAALFLNAGSLSAGSAAIEADVIATSLGNAEITGDVFAGRDYRVSGLRVDLGPTLGSATQRARRAIDITATTSGVSGRNELTLLSNSDGAGGGVLSIAALTPTGAIDFGAGTSILGGTAAERTAVSVTSLASLRLGRVEAASLRTIGLPTDLAVDGDVVLNDVTLDGPLVVRSALGSIEAGALHTGGAAALRAATDLRLGSVTAAAGSIALRSDTGEVRVGALSAGGTGADVTVVAAGAARVQGSVSATGDYSVQGASVRLGETPLSTQAADGAVEIAALTGDIEGGAGLTLQSNRDGTGVETLTLRAELGRVRLPALSTLLGGLDGARSEILLRSAPSLELGDVTGRSLRTIGDTALVTTGPLTAGPITLDGSFTARTTAGALTTGNVTLRDAGAALELAAGGAGSDLVARSLSTNGGGIRLSAGRDIVIDAAATGPMDAAVAGSIDLLAGRDITVTVVLNAGQDVSASAVRNALLPIVVAGDDIDLAADKMTSTVGRSTGLGPDTGPAAQAGGNITVAANRLLPGTPLAGSADTGIVVERLEGVDAQLTTDIGDIRIGSGTLTGAFTALSGGSVTGLREGWTPLSGVSTLVAPGTVTLSGVGDASFETGSITGARVVTAGSVAGSLRLGTVSALSVDLTAGTTLQIGLLASDDARLRTTGGAAGRFSLTDALPVAGYGRASLGAATATFDSAGAAQLDLVHAAGAVTVTAAALDARSVVSDGGAVSLTARLGRLGVGTADAAIELSANARGDVRIDAGTARAGSLTITAGEAFTAGTLTAGEDVAARSGGASTIDSASAVDIVDLGAGGLLTLGSARSTGAGADDRRFRFDLSLAGSAGAIATDPAAAADGDIDLVAPTIRVGTARTALGAIRATAIAGDVSGLAGLSSVDALLPGFGRGSLLADGDTSRIAVQAAGGIQLGSVIAGRSGAAPIGGNQVSVTGRALDLTEVRALNGGLGLFASGGRLWIDRGSSAANALLDKRGADGDLRIATRLDAGADALLTSGVQDPPPADPALVTRTDLVAATVTAGGDLLAFASRDARIDTGTTGGTLGVHARGGVTGGTLRAGEDVAIRARADASLTNVAAGDDLDIVAGGTVNVLKGATTGTGADGRGIMPTDTLFGFTTDPTPVAAQRGSNVTVSAARVEAGTLDARDALAITSTDGRLSLGSGSAGATATLVKQGATDGLAVSGTVRAGAGATVRSATDLDVATASTAAGDLTLDAVRDARLGAGAAQTGALTLMAGRNAVGGTLDAGLALTVAAGGDATLTQASAGGALGVTAGGTALIARGTAGGAVTVSAARVEAGTLGAGGALSVTATGGLLSLGSGSAGGFATLTKLGVTDGLTVTGILTAGTGALVSSTTDLDVNVARVTAGDLALNAARNAGLVEGSARAIAIAAGGNVAGGKLDAGLALSVLAGGDAALTEAAAGGDLAVTAAGVDAGTLSAGGALSITATTGRLALGTGSAGGFASLTKFGAADRLSVTGTLTAGTGARLSTASDLGVNTARVTSGDLALDASGNASIVEGDARGIAITAGGNVVGGKLGAGLGLTVSAGGDALLTEAVAGGDVAVKAVGAAVIDGATAGGNLSISAASVGAGTLGAGGTLAATATTGRLALGTGTAGGFASLTKLGAVDGLSVTGTLTAGTGARVSSATDLGVNVARVTAGDPMLSAARDASIADGDARAIGITAGGTVVGGRLRASDALTVSAGGDAYLTEASAGSDLGVAAGGTATIGRGTAGSGLTVSAARVEAGTLDAGGALSITADARRLSLGSGSAGGLAMLTKLGAADALTVAGTLTAGTGASLRSATDLSVGAVTARTGDLLLNAARDVTVGSATAQTGALLLLAGRDAAADTLVATREDVSARSGQNARFGTVLAGDNLVLTADGVLTIGRAESSGVGSDDRGFALDPAQAGGVGGVTLTAGSGRRGTLDLLGATIRFGAAASATGEVRITARTGDVTGLSTASGFGRGSASAAGAGRSIAVSATGGTALLDTLTAGVEGASPGGSDQIGVTARAVDVLSATGRDGGLRLTASDGRLLLGSGGAARTATLAKQGAADALTVSGTLTAGTGASLRSATDLNVAAAGTQTGDLTLEAARDATIGTGTAGAALAVAAGGTVVGDRLTAGEDLAIRAGGGARLTEAAAGDDLDLVAGGTLAIGRGAATATGSDARSVLFGAGGVGFATDAGAVVAQRGANVAISAARVDAGTLEARGALAVTATDGRLALGSATVGGTATLRKEGAADELAITGALVAGGDVALRSASAARIASAASTGGSLGLLVGGEASAAELAAAEDLGVSAGGAVRLGQVRAGDDVTIATPGAAYLESTAATGTGGDARRVALDPAAGGVAFVSGETLAGANILIRAASLGGPAMTGDAEAGLSVGTLTAGTAALTAANGDIRADALTVTAGGVALGAANGSVSGRRAGLVATGGGSALAARGQVLLDVAGEVAIGRVTASALSNAGRAVTRTMRLGAVDAGALDLTATDGLQVERATIAGAATLRLSGGTAGGVDGFGATRIEAHGPGAAITVTAGRTAQLGVLDTGGGADSAAGDQIAVRAAAIRLGGARARNGDVLLEARGPVALLGPVETRGDGGAIDPARAVVVRNTGSGATIVGGATAEGGADLALDDAEMDRIAAGQVTIDSRAGPLQVKALSIAPDTGRTALRLLTTGAIDLTGPIEGTGSGLLRIGGSGGGDLAGPVDPAALATHVRVETGAGGIVFANGVVELRGRRIVFGQASLLDRYLPASGAPADALAATDVASPASPLYVGDASARTYLTARTLRIGYSDFALFQNTAPSVGGGVTLNDRSPPAADGIALQLFGGGDGRGDSLALFGRVNGFVGRSAGVLPNGVLEIATPGSNPRQLRITQSNARVNGCVIGSPDKGCLVTDPPRPNFSIYDQRQTQLFGTADDATLFFNPLIGRGNEGLIVDIADAPVGIDTLECDPAQTGCPAPENAK